ncbi:GRF zinc finger domain-containing protein [Stachybotrys elegans]|uniref:GRF zinc finger domain-containing protein n=1 Tax=Stachybotrys elegans TaxID=80388 RepID=A0A8K0T163_9HYPO|nr:GRF zinc finger domain-containing protein [Stachybotrys elegans]
MKAFLARSKRKPSPETAIPPPPPPPENDEPTEYKLALLSSLHPTVDQEALLDVLLAHDGSVQQASASLQAGLSNTSSGSNSSSNSKSTGAATHQQSLKRYALAQGPASPTKKRIKTRRGTTLHLYDPEDVAEHTPCTIIHNFLPAQTANDLLRELLGEATSFEKISFKLFDNVVASPHTSGFYVESYDEMQAQKTDYLYNGARLSDVRRITPQLVHVKPAVQEAVNKEIQHRIATRYPHGKKLKHQSPKPWVPNSAFVNCYDGAQQSVGWHSDQLTYLGPRAVIGSLSLGVAREFRVRRISPREDDDGKLQDGDIDPAGQISIYLPHNSLLVMHAEMQEEWKHCVTPAASITPHPIAGNKRINVTYRDYRANMHPRFTPRCTCGVACVLRVVQRKKENFGKYFWMCHAGNIPGKESCSFFQWADFDDDGNPRPRQVNQTK